MVFKIGYDVNQAEKLVLRAESLIRTNGSSFELIKLEKMLRDMHDEIRKNLDANSRAGFNIELNDFMMDQQERLDKAESDVFDFIEERFGEYGYHAITLYLNDCDAASKEDLNRTFRWLSEVKAMYKRSTLSRESVRECQNRSDDVKSCV